jgi:hypothetical protein
MKAEEEEEEEEEEEAIIPLSKNEKPEPSSMQAPAGWNLRKYLGMCKSTTQKEGNKKPLANCIHCYS